MIDVMIVDDQQIIREGLKMMLSLSDEINVIGEAENGNELLELLRGKSPDIILMDIRMPGMDGVEATRVVKEKYPNIKVIILTTFNEDRYIFNGLKNGVDGYLLKDAKSQEIISAVNTVYHGNMLLYPEIATKVVKAFNSMTAGIIDTDNNEKNEEKLKDLTSREIEIAQLVKDGKSNKEISSALFIAEGTVKNHISNILNKLELDSRAKLVSYMTSN